MNDHQPRSTVVLGLGNVVHSDDGVGVHAVQRLRRDSRLPDDVEMIEGGTLGLDLLPHVWDASYLLILDAVDVDQPAGTLISLTAEEVWRLRGGGNAHLLGLADLLAALQLLAKMPQKITLLGVQPGSTAWGTELSPAVEQALPRLVTAAIDMLCRWSQPVQRTAS